jgi:hypothetical protein
LKKERKVRNEMIGKERQEKKGRRKGRKCKGTKM